MKLETALAMVMAECVRAEALYPVWPKDPVHQMAILCEESGEALQAALNFKERKGSKKNMVTEAVNTYLDNPGNLTISAEPENPVPFPMIMGAAMGAPNTLPDVLGVTVEANRRQ